MLLVSFLVYPSYTEIQQISSYIVIEIACLKEFRVSSKIIRTHWVHDFVSIWYVGLVIMFKINSNMTWFFSPIKSTDTNSALLAR